MSLESTINLKDYDKKSALGVGGFGEVFQVSNKKTGEIFAAKVSLYPLELISHSLIRNLRREIDIMSRLNHPTVLKFFGFSLTNFYDEDKPTIITEYMPTGSLADVLNLERKSISKIGWDDTRKLITIYGIASAMKYLHKNRIIHRDLKPGNILMDEYLIPKVADFGLSKVLHTNTSTRSSQSTIGLKGTIHYMAPEIHTKKEYTKATDVYAFAIIVYEIITNEIPFSNLKAFEIGYKVANNIRPEFKYEPPDSYKQLIESCWSQDPKDRPTFDDIVDDLENDSGFITETVDENDYQMFIDYIKDYKTTFVEFATRKGLSFPKINIKEEVKKQKEEEKKNSINVPAKKTEKNPQRTENKPAPIKLGSSTNGYQSNSRNSTKDEEQNIIKIGSSMEGYEPDSRNSIRTESKPAPSLFSSRPSRTESKPAPILLGSSTRGHESSSKNPSRTENKPAPSLFSSRSSRTESKPAPILLGSSTRGQKPVIMAGSSMRGYEPESRNPTRTESRPAPSLFSSGPSRTEDKGAPILLGSSSRGYESNSRNSTRTERNPAPVLLGSSTEGYQGFLF
ncbi:hypothetical protein M9Y10_003073 [Tritrichomonas musculus]|uniref:Protein kinase domain-containing protein n=1 Tax=Tritrichomonas musculus TaxID=1915356 RepID=A0ABR2JPS6_9EUKA